MEKRPLLFISSILCVVLALAQEVDSLKIDSISAVDTVSISSDSVAINIKESVKINPEDTIPKKFLTIGPYIDFGKLLTIPTDFETKYEGGLELLFFERYAIYAEAGSTTTSPKEAYTNGTYESTGTYYRIGAGYVGSFDPQHNIGLSFRYGSSSFEESGRVFLESPTETQEPLVRSIERTNLTAQWWEVVVYSDQQLLKNSELLWFGLNIRLRILQRYDEQESPDVYAIPGYGRSFDKTIPAANFFLKIKF